MAPENQKSSAQQSNKCLSISFSFNDATEEYHVYEFVDGESRLAMGMVFSANALADAFTLLDCGWETFERDKETKKFIFDEDGNKIHKGKCVNLFVRPSDISVLNSGARLVKEVNLSKFQYAGQ